MSRAKRAKKTKAAEQKKLFKKVVRFLELGLLAFLPILTFWLLYAMNQENVRKHANPLPPSPATSTHSHRH